MDWLGRTQGTATAHVLPEHADRFGAYARSRHRNLGRSVVLMVVLAALLVLSVVLHRPRSTGVVLLLMATGIWAFPFATPPAVESLGVRRSVVLVRAGAIALAAFGVWYVWR